MAPEPDARDVSTLKDRLDDVRRSLFGDQSRLKRRRDEAKRLGELETRLQEPALAPVDRKAIEDVCGTLRRGLERSRLVDGSDEALAERTARIEAAAFELERQLRELKTQEASAARAAGSVDAQRERERAQRARRQKLVTSLGACARQVEALEAGAGVAAAATTLDDADLSDQALRARLSRLSARVERVALELRHARYRAGIRVTALEQELVHWGRQCGADKGLDPDALSRHLRNELQRFVLLLDAHLALRLEQAVQYMEESAIGRFNQTDAEPEADPAFEQISFRREDIRLLGDLASCLVEPHLQAQSLLLPARSAIALASFRGAELSRLAQQPELHVPAIAAPQITQLVQRAVQLKGVAPLAPRVEVPPLRRLRRGDLLGALGALLARAGRFPAKVLQPLAMLSLLSFSVMKEFRNELSQMQRSTVAAILVLLIMLTYRSWTKEARLGEIELLRKGKTMLRERVTKELDDLRQAWKRLLTEHCERFIDQTIAELKRRGAGVASDEVRIQREVRRVESELRERGNDQRRLLDADHQARRMANENMKTLAAAIEAELATSESDAKMT